MMRHKNQLEKICFIFVVLLFPLMMWGCSKTDIPSTVAQGNPNPDPFHPVGTIQGKLVDSVTLYPISGAIIDIGVAKVTTSDTGQFKMANVPATYDGISKTEISGAYSATIDLRNVNKAIAAANAKTGATQQAKYPDFKYDSITVKYSSFNESASSTNGGIGNLTNSTNDGTISSTGSNQSSTASNHDTPVDHLIAQADLSVGKLDANIEGVVAKGGVMKPAYEGASYKVCDQDPYATGTDHTADYYTPVGAGYIVKLYTNSSNDTAGINAGGAYGHLIGQTTTDANGKYTFSNVEAKLYVKIDALSADGKLEASKSTSTLADGETLSLTDIQQSNAIHLCSLDIHGPEIVSVSPEPGSDNTPGSIDVVLGFSEPIAQTPQTSTDSSGQDNLYHNIEVNWDGNKAGNVAYSLAWNSTFDKLTVTIPKTETSSLYHVLLPAIDSGVLADADGNKAALGICPNSAPSIYNVESGSTDCVVYFTTKGGTTAGTPDISLVNAASLDEGGTTAGILDWAPVSGAKKYNVYCTRNQVWGTTIQKDTTLLEDTVYSSQDTVYFDTFVENGDTKLTHDCFVRGVNSDGVEGPDSNIVTGEDKVGPTLEPVLYYDSDVVEKVACGSTIDTTKCDTDGKITDIYLKFDEVLDKASAQTITNYTISVASGTTPTVSAAVYDPSHYFPYSESSSPSVQLTLSSPLDPADLTPSSIGPGTNGVIDSTKAGDDVIIRPSCVGPGSNKFLETSVSGDDVIVANPSGGDSINVGPNGVCESTKAGDDTQDLPVGKGKASSICITAGPNGILNTTTATGDDVVSGTVVNAGPDGICNTVATMDDVQEIAVGDGLGATSITAGANMVLNTTVAGDDVLTGGAVVNVSGVTDVSGNTIRTTGDQYNTDGSVE